MEVKINKEIRDYTESVFFGLSLRQLVFSVIACAAAAAAYFTPTENIQRPLSLRILITALREKRIRRPCSLNTASFLILLTAQR